MNLVNITIKTNGFKNTYINHFVDFINKITNNTYFGIKIKDNDIIIEEIDKIHVNEIIDMLFFNGRDSYFQYNVIESINIKES